MKLKRLGAHKIRKWKKNLYENIGYADNYTDRTFLEELRKNINVVDIPLRDIVLGAGRVTQELCIVVLFITLFVYLYNGWIQPQGVFVSSALLTFLGYVTYRVWFKQMYLKNFMKDCQTVLIFLVFGYFLSPVLKTLTDTISTDTIFAMATFMMFIHLVFFDYGISASIVSSALSLNAAIFASVCLASRLVTAFHAFVLLTNTVECFALLPIFLSEVNQSVSLLLVTILVTVGVVWTVSKVMTVLLVCVVIFITLVCPFLFRRWQHFKDNIHGPWDEAVVQDQDM